MSPIFVQKKNLNKTTVRDNSVLWQIENSKITHNLSILSQEDEDREIVCYFLFAKAPNSVQKKSEHVSQLFRLCSEMGGESVQNELNSSPTFLNTFSAHF